MPSLQELRGGSAKKADVKSENKPPPKLEPETSTKGEPGEARLAFLVEHKLLPPYLSIGETPPETEPEAAPTPWAQQARNEWPLVAANLSIPKGQFHGNRPFGAAYLIGDRYLDFNLDLLWQHLNLFE